jgi:peptidoglycan/LPS O-acetylase OafA/YrhL
VGVSSDFDTTVSPPPPPASDPIPSFWSRFRRITSGSPWLPEVDGLRFVAILSVVLFHLAAELDTKSGHALTYRSWYAPLTSVLGNGHLGVLLFFVISGFILGRPFARHFLLARRPVPLRAYYLRRLTRLEPPYLLNLLLCALTVRLYTHASFGYLLRQFAVSAVYLHDLVYHTFNPLNPVVWTLEIEVQFYLLVPLLTLVFLVRPTALRRLLLLAAIIAIPKLQEHYFWNHLSVESPIWGSILFYLQYFLAGLLLSDLYVLDLPRWRPARAWDLASAAAWFLLFVWEPRWMPTYWPVLLLVASLGALRGVFFPRLFRVEWLATVGGMCYSIYLWHFFLIALIFKATRHLVLFADFLPNFLIQCALMLPLILLGAAAYFRLIERPCMDPAWPQKLRAALSQRFRRPSPLPHPRLLESELATSEAAPASAPER